MPPIVTILLVLAMAIVVVLMITSRNPTHLTEEQSAKFAKIFRILVPLVLVAAAVKFFIGG